MMATMSMPPVDQAATGAHVELDLYAGVDGFVHENVIEGPEAAYAADLYEDGLVKPEGDTNHDRQQFMGDGMGDNNGDGAGLEYKSYTTVHPKSQLQQEKEAKIAASLHSKGERGKQLYIGNLTWWTTDEELENLIQECGVTDLISIKFFDNRANGQSKGFALIEIGSETSHRLVMERIGNQECHGNKPEGHFVNKQTLSMLEAVARKNKPGIPGAPDDFRGPPRPMGRGERFPFGRGDRFPRPGFHRPGMPPHGMPPHGMQGEMPPPHFMHGGPPPQHRAPFPGHGMGPPHDHGMPPGGPPVHHGMPPPQQQMDPMVAQGMQGMQVMPGPGMQMHGMPPGMPGGQVMPGMHGMPGHGMPGMMPPASQPPPVSLPHEAMMHERPPMMPKSGIAPHVNPAFLPPDALAQVDPFGMGVGMRQNEAMAMQRAAAMGAPGIAGMSEAEIESMRRNQAVASTAIQRAMADANSGDYESGIETLVTAISLIKQSSTANAESSQVLVQSLQDCLHGLEAQLMTKGRDKDRDSRGYSPTEEYRDERRHRSRRHRSRSRSRSRDRRRSWSPREHRSRSRERSSRSRR